MPEITKSYGKTVTIIDSLGNLITIGDGDAVVVENNEGIVTTKVMPVAGRDHRDTARFLRTSNDGFLDITQTELFSVFNLMLKELKIMNIHLTMATDNEIKEQEIDA